MNQQKSAFLNQILQKRLELESQRWLTAMAQRFDVAVLCPSPELFRVVSVFLLRKLGQTDECLSEQNNCCIEVDPRHLPSEDRGGSPSLPSRPPRYLHICHGKPPTGTGAILFELPPLQHLLPSPASMVSLLLTNTGLERFVDAFDGARMTSLKKILERYGLDIFFDCVVQTAYLGGYKGDLLAADRCLENLLKPPPENREAAKTLSSVPEQPAPSLEGLIELLLGHPEPHDVLKAAMAHYVFHRKNVSQAEASRMLKISRSTLQAHLQMAERLKVYEYFRFENPIA
ncbi:MAG: hypothetical protein RIR26_20 [Pseudomonadota bacterium]